jgi:hypothetical protein
MRLPSPDSTIPPMTETGAGYASCQATLTGLAEASLEALTKFLRVQNLIRVSERSLGATAQSFAWRRSVGRR